ncbi:MULTISPECIES: LytR C-terminal domain-containing protein [unclassified Streptomyces]|uniref:LytR C-terminal domain-containing protein n=1 Tax=unclassified Streptomyces TaxID=2593676 RepID=UPI001903362E|nr:LytR C-terminal domain-containing protein [Streptomyces sp. HSG2]
MGGRYRVTGDTHPRMRTPRRRGRLALLVTACLAGLGLLGWGTLQLLHVFGQGDAASAAGAKPACATAAARTSPSPAAVSPAISALPKPGDVTVNVLNATTRSGLAQKTADELEKRGFAIGEVANAPAEFDKKVSGTGILLGSTGSEKTALRLLGFQVADAERRADTAREGAEVDLVLGDAFTGLRKRADAEAALTAATAPKPAESPAREC